jgi:DNA (cytosine-5)-methyltransferase 1
MKFSVTDLASSSAVASRVTALRESDAAASRTPRLVTPEPVLSIFPGADLLGRGFEEEGYCVVRGPDLVWGGDIRRFHPTPGIFAGVIGGSPCQQFSGLNRNPVLEIGLEMLGQFVRVVRESECEWFVMENVPAVPDVVVPGYTVQRLNLSAAECGGRQRRNRCFQFGSRDGACISPKRARMQRITERAAIASEAARDNRRTFADFCELQGLPRDFDLPGLSLSAKYKAVGNGVPVYMARVIARAVRERLPSRSAALCVCGCGRSVAGRQTMATAACRKRMERRRRIA